MPLRQHPQHRRLALTPRASWRVVTPPESPRRVRGTTKSSAKRRELLNNEIPGQRVLPDISAGQRSPLSPPGSQWVRGSGHPPNQHLRSRQRTLRLKAGIQHRRDHRSVGPHPTVRRSRGPDTPVVNRWGELRGPSFYTRRQLCGSWLEVVWPEPQGGVARTPSKGCPHRFRCDQA